MSDVETPDTPELSDTQEGVESEPSVDTTAANDQDGTTEVDEYEPLADDELSRSYKVKVGGEEIEISLGEALNGYMRQADYTRKTQELAPEREQLASMQALVDALNDDPSGTLQALSQIYGIQLGSPESFDELDPQDSAMRTLEQRLMAQEQVTRQNQVEREASAAIQKHGLDVGPEAVLKYAVDNQIGSLDRAAQYLKLEQAQQRETETAPIVAAKRRQNVVSGASGRTSGATGRPQPKSIFESYEQVMADLS